MVDVVFLHKVWLYIALGIFPRTYHIVGIVSVAMARTQAFHLLYKNGFQSHRVLECKAFNAFYKPFCINEHAL